MRKGAVVSQVAKRVPSAGRALPLVLSAGWEPPRALALGICGLTGVLVLSPCDRQFAASRDFDTLDDEVDLICGPGKTDFQAYHRRMKETSSSKMDPFLIECATYPEQPTQGSVTPVPGAVLDQFAGTEGLGVVLAYRRPRAGIVGHVKCTTRLTREDNGRDLSLQVCMPNIAVLPRFRKRGIGRDLLAGAFVIVDSWLRHVARKALPQAEVTIDLYVEVESAIGGRLANRLSDLLEYQTVVSLNEDFIEDESRRTVEFVDSVY